MVALVRVCNVCRQSDFNLTRFVVLRCLLMRRVRNEIYLPRWPSGSALLVTNHNSRIDIALRRWFVITPAKRIDADIAVVVFVKQVINSHIRPEHQPGRLDVIRRPQAGYKVIRDHNGIGVVGK